MQTSPTIAAPIFTGDVNFDSGTLFVDSMNNRVGFLNTSPTYPIHLKTSAASDLVACVENTNSVSSTANSVICLSVGGTSAGDPYFQSIVTGGSSWSFGLDNSDSDKFKFSASAFLGTNDRFTLDTSGNGSFSGTATATQLISTVATGTAPLVVSSTTKVTNLNVDLLDDLTSADFALRAMGVKAWGSVNVAGPSYDGSYNLSGSPSSGGTGIWTVTFDTDFADNTYAVVATRLASTAGYVTVSSVSAGACTFRVFNGAGALEDTNFRFMVIGTQ